MYPIEINGGMTTVTTVDDMRTAVKFIQSMIATAWQKVRADGLWYSQLPDTILVPLSDDFKRRYWSQLAPDWLPEPEDEEDAVARVRWRLVSKKVDGHELSKISFYFEDHPAFEIYSSTV